MSLFRAGMLLMDNAQRGQSPVRRVLVALGISIVVIAIGLSVGVYLLWSEGFLQ